MRFLPFILFVCLSTLSFHSFANTETLPENLKVSLMRAHQTGDSFIINAVKNSAETQYPGTKDAIDAYLASLENASPTENKPIKATSSTPAKSPWKGDIELGVNVSNGNSKQENANGAFSLTYDATKWSNTLTLKARGSKEDSVRTDEEYRANNQTRYHLSDLNYTFLELEYVNDRFSGFDRRTTENIGYGHYFWKKPRFKLSGEASAGTRQARKTNGETDSNLIQKLSGKMAWNIYDGIDFTQDLNVSFGNDATITESESALKTKAADNLYLKFGVNVEHVSNVPADRKNTDTNTTIGVVYGF